MAHLTNQQKNLLKAAILADPVLSAIGRNDTEMARQLNLPLRCSGNFTTSKLPDAQAMTEGTMSMLAAIHCGAETIITFNLKDFPARTLDRYNLDAQHPDDFIVDLFDLHPASVLQALAEQRASLKKPPKTADEFLDILLKQGLTQTVSILKDWKVAF